MGSGENPRSETLPFSLSAFSSPFSCNRPDTDCFRGPIALGGAWQAAPFARPHPSVARISVVDREGMSLGSGSLVTVDERLGLVVTCWHVIQDAAGPIVVSFPGGFRSAATVVRTDRQWDLAALAIHRPPAPPIAISPHAPQPDEILMLAGYGGNGEYRAVAGRCTQYLAPERNWPMELVELDAPARQGDSGGPIFNSRGELAGVLSGSGFGQTCGTYCGRVRWFLGLADAAFRHVSSEEAWPANAGTTSPPRRGRADGRRASGNQTGLTANASALPFPIAPLPPDTHWAASAEPVASIAAPGDGGGKMGEYAKNGEGKTESGRGPKSAASPLPSPFPSDSPASTLR